MIAYRLLGSSLLATGAPEAGAAALQTTLALFDADQHTALAYRYGADIKVMTLCLLALTQWLLDRKASAERSIDEARRPALELGHSNTLAYCDSFRLAILALEGDEEELEQTVGALTTLAVEQGLPVWLAVSKGYVGWLHLRRGDLLSAVQMLQDCVASVQSISVVYWQPTVWMWLGEARGKNGDLLAADAAFERSKALMAATGECWAHAELYRVWANTRLLLNAAGAAELFGDLLRVAAEQGAMAWSRRTKLDLSMHDAVGAGDSFPPEPAF